MSNSTQSKTKKHLQSPTRPTTSKVCLEALSMHLIPLSMEHRNPISEKLCDLLSER